MEDGELPLGGAISAYFREDAPQAVRDAIAVGASDDILDHGFPYRERLARRPYDRRLKKLQVELVKMQAWAKASGARVAVVFEGRDAAGKGGTIKRFREHLNPRGARNVALPKPSDTEAGQWYFQRYVEHLPAAGEIVFFDRSWYNRGVVEHVFGFCTDAQREQFFAQVVEFERMVCDDGIHLFKLWLNVGRAEQLRRFLARERDPLKQWKLSRIDAEGLRRWDAYTAAIGETLHRSDSGHAPWLLIRADDKRRARLAAIRHVLAALPYSRKDAPALGRQDPHVAGGIRLWDG